MAKRLTIMLVDDERQFLDALDERMKVKGFETVLAENGEQALEKAKEHKIDVAIVDLKMPGMDGLTCIAKLKELNEELKTVLLTGYGDAKIREATKGLESAYFEKGEMGGFWDFVKSLSKKLETSMAAAGYADQGDVEGAKDISKQK